MPHEVVLQLCARVPKMFQPIRAREMIQRIRRGTFRTRLKIGLRRVQVWMHRVRIRTRMVTIDVNPH